MFCLLVTATSSALSALPGTEQVLNKHLRGAAKLKAFGSLEATPTAGWSRGTLGTATGPIPRHHTLPRPLGTSRLRQVRLHIGLRVPCPLSPACHSLRETVVSSQAVMWSWHFTYLLKLLFLFTHCLALM